MSNNSSKSAGGIGFASVLTIVFVVLKLCNVISWSWLWVLSPLWISFAVCLLLFLICVIAISIKG